MTVWIDTTRNGRDCLRNDCSGKTESLLTDCILVRMSDGAVTICEPTSLPAISRTQVQMIEYFLAEKGMSKPNVFAGQPAREAPQIDATNQKEQSA